MCQTIEKVFFMYLQLYFGDFLFNSNYIKVWLLGHNVKKVLGYWHIGVCYKTLK